MTFLGHVINGLSLGSIYAIIALGYTMVYGIAKMLNFAHGDVIMVGSYLCFFAVNSFSLPPLVGILLAMALCTVLGIVIERLAYKPLRQAPSLAVLITAIGVSYLLQNGAQLLWGASPKSFPTDFFNFGGQKGMTLFDGALNISYAETDAVAKQVPSGPGALNITLDEALNSQRREEACSAARGKNVVRTCVVIPERFG